MTDHIYGEESIKISTFCTDCTDRPPDAAGSLDLCSSQVFATGSFCFSITLQFFGSGSFFLRFTRTTRGARTDSM